MRQSYVGLVTAVTLILSNEHVIADTMNPFLSQILDLEISDGREDDMKPNDMVASGYNDDQLVDLQINDLEALYHDVDDLTLYDLPASNEKFDALLSSLTSPPSNSDDVASNLQTKSLHMYLHSNERELKEEADGPAPNADPDSGAKPLDTDEMMSPPSTKSYGESPDYATKVPPPVSEHSNVLPKTNPSLASQQNSTFDEEFAVWYKNLLKDDETSSPADPDGGAKPLDTDEMMSPPRTKSTGESPDYATKVPPPVSEHSNVLPKTNPSLASQQNSTFDEEFAVWYKNLLKDDETSSPADPDGGAKPLDTDEMMSPPRTKSTGESPDYATKVPPPVSEHSNVLPKTNPSLASQQNSTFDEEFAVWYKNLLKDDETSSPADPDGGAKPLDTDEMMSPPRTKSTGESPDYATKVPPPVSEHSNVLPKTNPSLASQQNSTFDEEFAVWYKNLLKDDDTVGGSTLALNKDTTDDADDKKPTDVRGDLVGGATSTTSSTSSYSFASLSDSANSKASPAPPPAFAQTDTPAPDTPVTDVSGPIGSVTATAPDPNYPESSDSPDSPDTPDVEAPHSETPQCTGFWSKTQSWFSTLTPWGNKACTR